MVRTKLLLQVPYTAHSMFFVYFDWSWSSNHKTYVFGKTDAVMWPQFSRLTRTWARAIRSSGILNVTRWPLGPLHSAKVHQTTFSNHIPANEITHTHTHTQSFSIAFSPFTCFAYLYRNCTLFSSSNTYKNNSIKEHTKKKQACLSPPPPGIFYAFERVQRVLIMANGKMIQRGDPPIKNFISVCGYFFDRVFSRPTEGMDLLLL